MVKQSFVLEPFNFHRNSNFLEIHNTRESNDLKFRTNDNKNTV